MRIKYDCCKKEAELGTSHLVTVFGEKVCWFCVADLVMKEKKDESN